ncbi:glycosyltransferase, partial [Acinetobacter baumannii]
DMVVETLTAIQSITYPHQAYLCDESNDEYLKKICTTLGVHHITRTQKTNAKAGNINNALKYSTGELCVVLDPDHVPYPNFLDP